MKSKKYVWLTLALIVFVILYETIVHGGILSGLYDATASVWRPEESMSEFMPWMMVGQVLFAIVFAVLYCCSQCRSNVIDGVKFGFLVGLLMGSAAFIYYAVLPIPLSLFAAWFFFGIIETIVMGIISALIVGKKE